MKLKLLSLAIVAFISSAAFAQKVKVGFKAGANINKLSGQSFKENFSFGYQLGGFVEVGLGKKFAVQPEILFNQINSDTSNNFSSVYQFKKIDKVQLKYLSIPLLFSYKPIKILAFQAGPQFGILLNKNNTLLQNGKEAFKSGDLSMVGGVQLTITKFMAYARYNIGLNDINDIDNKEKWKNQSIQLGVGFIL